MTLRERLYGAVVAQMERVAAELAAQAPHRDARSSIVAPPPGELPEVLERLRAQRRLGQPDIHLGEWTRPSFLSKNRQEAP